jgi:hypothetical protein
VLATKEGGIVGEFRIHDSDLHHVRTILVSRGLVDTVALLPPVEAPPAPPAHVPNGRTVEGNLWYKWFDNIKLDVPCSNQLSKTDLVGMLKALLGGPASPDELTALGLLTPRYRPSHEVKVVTAVSASCDQVHVSSSLPPAALIEGRTHDGTQWGTIPWAVPGDTWPQLRLEIDHVNMQDPLWLTESDLRAMLLAVNPQALTIPPGAKPPKRYLKSPALRLIEDERLRQIDGKGYDAERDDKYINGQLAAVAACFAAPVGRIYQKAEFPYGAISFSNMWPSSWDKKRDTRPKSPTAADRIKILAKAGALVAAEMDRLQRVLDRV